MARMYLSKLHHAPPPGMGMAPQQQQRDRRDSAPSMTGRSPGGAPPARSSGEADSEATQPPGGNTGGMGGMGGVGPRHGGSYDRNGMMGMMGGGDRFSTASDPSGGRGNVGGGRAEPEHEEVELLLENYAQELGASISLLELLSYSIESDEKFVSYRLDSARRFTSEASSSFRTLERAFLWCPWAALR